MDTNNWRPTPPGGENTMDSGDWRTTLQPDSRQRIVNKIMDTLKRHLPFSGQEGLNELRKIAVRFEEKIFTAASSQSDYLRRISLKMLTMEIKSQSTMSNTGNTSKPPDPASLDSTAQTGQANVGDWQEEVYQKIKAMKETYLPELIEMHQKIAAKLLQHDSLPQQPKSEQLDKLKIFKTMLERILHFLTVSKANVVPAYKEKLSSYERQILSFINAYRPRKLISAMQQGQLPPPHMHFMQQSQPQINQTQSHDNQMNPQLQSINLQGSMSTMQPNNMTSIQHNSLSSFAPVNFENPVYDAYISHQHATYEEAGSECPAPDTARNGMPTMLPPSLLPGFEKDGDANGNALTTAFGKPDIKEQTHDSMVNMAKPNSLRLTVVTMADEAVTAVGEELAAMRKQGVHARTFFIQTGMTGAEKMKWYLGACAMFVLVIYFIFDLYCRY